MAVGRCSGWVDCLCGSWAVGWCVGFGWAVDSFFAGQVVDVAAGRLVDVVAWRLVDDWLGGALMWRSVCSKICWMVGQ